MSVLPGAIEVLILRTIWIGAAGLALASLAVMTVLIIRRVGIDRRDNRMALRREELSRVLFAALKSPVALDSRSLPPVTPEDYPAIIGLSLDLLRSLRGPDTRRIVDVLRLWDIDRYLHRWLSDGRRGQRIKALTLFGHFDDDASMAALLRQVKARDIYVQTAALRALVLRGRGTHIDQIVASLTRSEQTNTPLLHDILQRLGRPAVPGLIALTLSEARVEVRVAAVMALGSIGDLEALPDLIRLVGDDAVDIRAQALHALGRLGDIRAASTVAGALKAPETAVRAQAAQALGAMTADRHLPDIAMLIEDPDWWVRFRAAEALYRLGDRGVALLTAFSGRSDAAGNMARQVLQEFRA